MNELLLISILEKLTVYSDTFICYRGFL